MNVVVERATHDVTSSYHYTPSEAWCLAFIILFSLSGIAHSVQAFCSKYWVVYPTLCAGVVLELVGWSGRLWSNQNVLMDTPFVMQISTLIIGPVFFSAYNYVVLGSAINTLGPQYSLVSPKFYYFIFITADLISLILQAVGGGQAASQASTNSPTASATHLMVGGIIFQLISMVVFLCLGIDFVIRVATSRPYAFQKRRLATPSRPRKWWGGQKAQAPIVQHRQSDGFVSSNETRADSSVPSNETASDLARKEVGESVSPHLNMMRWYLFLAAAAVSSLMIILRGVYRSVELSQGWTGYLIERQIYQNLLDGIPMSIAVLVFNFVHPVWLLPKKTTWGPYH